MATMHNLFSLEPKAGSRFVAFLDDGSGANLFMRDDSGNYYSAEGEIVSQTWLEDAGYVGFIYLPKYFKLAFED